MSQVATTSVPFNTKIAGTLFIVLSQTSLSTIRWRGYDVSVPGKVAETAPSGGRTT